MHEYGHYIDSQKFGFLYLPVVGLPSLFNAMGDDSAVEEWKGKDVKEKNIWGLNKHDIFYAETFANKLAADYFGLHYGVEWSSKNKYLFGYYPLKNPFR